MAFGDADLPAFFADMGVPVTYGAVTVFGLVDAYDERDGSAQAMVDVADRITDVTVPADAFPVFPPRGALLTLNGAAYRVRDVVQQKDGGIAHLFLVTP